MEDRQPHIILVGAGLAGSLLAVYMAKRGFRVDLYERRPDMRTSRISAGRSINLALSTRGIHALREVGLYDDIRTIAIPMYGRMIHPLAGGTVFSRYGKDDTEYINAVDRGDLNKRLMTLAERHPGVRIRFNARCTGIDLDSGEVRLRDEESGEEFNVRADTVIGTDGSASAIRDAMAAQKHFTCTQEPLDHGYKELRIPPGADGAFLIEKHALHIWPRSSYMLIALPNIDASFTLTLFLQHEGTPGFSSLGTPEAVRSFFAQQFPDAAELMPSLTEDFFANPTGALTTVRSAPWHTGGRAALLGDAAHAIVPFFGQGMNCCFEDCSVLDACIGRHGTDWARVYDEYDALRKPNADAIADLALENFIEMRDLVADPHFLLMKQVGLALEQRFPEWFVPKYSMVTFHRIPYATARARGRVQDGILETLCASATRVDDIDWDRAHELITRALPPFREA